MRVLFGLGVLLLSGAWLGSSVLLQAQERQARTQGKDARSRAVKESGEVKALRFKHSGKARDGVKGHRDVKCEDCHKGAVNARKTNPGHEACDSCHSDYFYGGKETFNAGFCRACHEEKAPAPWKDMKAIHYADRPHLKRYYYVEFNHKKHVGLSSTSGVESCNQCHFNKDSMGMLETRKPSHKNCGTSDCHGTDSELKLTLNNCGGCHMRQRDRVEGELDALGNADEIPKKNLDAYKEQVSKGVCRVGVVEMDYPKGKRGGKTRKGKFSHKKHLAWGEQMKEAVDCATCHSGTREAETLAQVQLFDRKGKVTMRGVCGQCHNGKKSRGYGKSVFSYNSASSCGKCHQPGCSTSPDFNAKDHLKDLLY